MRNTILFTPNFDYLRSEYFTRYHNPEVSQSGALFGRLSKRRNHSEGANPFSLFLFSPPGEREARIRASKH
jgi:hypothetical protein